MKQQVGQTLTIKSYLPGDTEPEEKAVLLGQGLFQQSFIKP